MPNKTSKTSIAKTIVIGFQLAVLIPLIIVGGISLFISHYKLQKELNTQNKLISQALVAQVKEYLRQPFEDLSAIKMVVEETSIIDHQIMDSLLKSVTENHAFFIKTQIIDQEGTVVNVYPLDEEFIGIDMSKMELFSILDTGKSSHWSSVFLSPQLNQPVASLSIPVNDKILTGYLSLAGLVDLIESLDIRKQNFVGIIDQTGTYIAHSDQKVVERRERDPHFLKMTDFESEKLVNLNLIYQEDKKYCSIYVIEDLNWIIIVAQSTSEYLKPLVSQVIFILVLTLSVLLIAWFIVIKKAQSIKLAFKMFINRTDEISSGNYDAEISIDSYTEFTRLADSFEIMAKSIKSREDKIRHMKNELEEKVAERTEELQYEIDERKQIEENLLLAKKEAELANQLKSEFLANISHELRNPMHHILSYSKYGIEKIDRPKEKLLHYFRQTRTSAERLMVLVNDLLDLSKMESGKMDYTFDYNNVHEIMKEALSELKPAIQNKKLILTLVDHPMLSTSIICDYYKVGQVVRNLLSNAIKFTPEEKCIDTKIERDELIYEKISIPALKVSVCDQGVGIPEDELALVFDKFTQSSKTKTGAGGTGLGLSICKEIIEAHHGKIWAENNPDGGATFSFMLPYQQEVD
jgi:signal transduction histidine kinase